MKQLFTVALIVAVLFLFVTPSNLLAKAKTVKTGGVLVVHATDGNLNAIITADAGAHSVYRLVSVDTTYLFDDAITATQDISIIGVPGVNGKLPTIQPTVLQDGTIPATFVNLNYLGITGTFKNLYLLALATNNSPNAAGTGIQVSADNVTTIVDNCVFDNWLGFAVGYSGNWDNFTITGSKFLNMVHPNQQYVGEVLRNEWSANGTYTGSVIMRDNTILCVNGYAAAPVTKLYTTYFEFVHNTVAYTFKNPFFIFNATRAKINDNIFYANYAGGVDMTENPWWDNLWVGDTTYGVIALERLSHANALMFDPADAANPSVDSIAESMRVIEVKNNVYFQPAALVNHWATWNASATNKVITPMWMNVPTQAMFADKVTWPGLVESGNVNVDPGFGSSITGVLNAGTPASNVGLLAWFDELRGGTALSDVWGAYITQVGTNANWTPTWPLAAASALHYSASLTGSDGLPVGDPNWFSGQASKELVVYATQGNLNTIITADAGAHSVYKLVSVDTTYLFDDAITATQDISIIGVPGANGKLPTIQPAVLQDGTIPATFINLNAASITGTFNNLYLLALATNNSPNAAGTAIQVSADNVSTIVDNCVFDNWLGFAVGYSGNWDNFTITNSYFRNMVHPNQQYVGEVLRNEWSANGTYTGSVIMKKNIILCVNGYAAAPVTKLYTTYFEFSDNIVAYTFKNPFFIFNATKAKINNNVFYANYAGGVDMTENPWWDNLWVGDTTYGVIALERLSHANALLLDPADAANPSVDSIAESMRTIEVKNNKYFQPAALVSHWATWNASATNKVITPMWMNVPTQAMFADKVTWPGLVESGNVNADPGYGASITGVLNAGTPTSNVGLLAWFDELRGGTALSDVWGCYITQVGTAVNWTPAWPLPELAGLNIVTSVASNNAAVPKAFNLSQNYPNPFNPTTTIQYTLVKSGITSLKVYNILGQHVMTVVNNVFQAANTYTQRIDMSNFTSGIYFCVLEQGGNRSAQKMMLLK